MKIQEVLPVTLFFTFSIITIDQKQNMCHVMLFGVTRTSLNYFILPLRGEPWGDAGGLECKDDAIEIVSSVCFLPLISSVVPKIFWGKLVPKNKIKEANKYHFTIKMSAVA